jgi:predicted RNase H-like HicB family nuclease
MVISLLRTNLNQYPEHSAVPQSGYSKDMARQFDVVIERDEEGLYVASVPQLPGCHTDATSLDELMMEIREAIQLCLDVEGDGAAPLEFVGIQRVTIAA